MSCAECNKAIKAIKSQINQMSSGYKNLIIKNNEVEEIAHKRLQLCLACEHIKVLGIMKLDILAYCNKCKCPIQAKIRSIDKDTKCPTNKW